MATQHDKKVRSARESVENLNKALRDAQQDSRGVELETELRRLLVKAQGRLAELTGKVA